MNISVRDEAETAPTPSPAERDTESVVGRSARLQRVLARGGVFVFAVVVTIVFTLTTDQFMTYGNWVIVLETASVVLIVSLGQTFCIVSGGFDLSVGGMVPLGAVVYARLTSSGMSIWLSIVIVLATGFVCGLVNATLTGKVGINPLITTLGTMSIAGGTAYILASGQTIIAPPAAGFLGNPGPAELPVYTYLAIVLTILAYIVLSHTILGRRIYVVGGNPEAARLAGIWVFGVQISVYCLSAVLAAVAGVVYASQLLAASGGIGAETALQSIAAVVLGGAALTGGTGGVPGTVLGVLILGAVANGLTLMRVAAFYQAIVTGIVLLAAVTFSALLASGTVGRLLHVARPPWARRTRTGGTQ